MIEAANGDENGVLPSAWSVELAAQRRHVSVARKSKPSNQKRRRLLEVPEVRSFELLAKCVFA